MMGRAKVYEDGRAFFGLNNIDSLLFSFCFTLRKGPISQVAAVSQRKKDTKSRIYTAVGILMEGSHGLVERG